MRSLPFGFALVGALFATAITAPALQSQRPVVVTVPRDADVRTRFVSYRDLDFSAADAERILRRRVKSAVSEVCTINDSQDSEFRCRTATWKDVQPSIAEVVQSKMMVASRGSGVIAVRAVR